MTKPLGLYAAPFSSCLLSISVFVIVSCNYDINIILIRSKNEFT